MTAVSAIAHARRYFALMTQESAPSAVTRARCRRRDCAGWLLPTSRSRRSFTMSNSVRFFVPAPQSCGRVLAFLCILVASAWLRGPEMRGPAERREAYYLSCRARRARRHACEAWGVPRKTGTPPLGAPPWRCRPRNRSGPGTICGSGREAARGQPLLMAGYGPGLFVPRLYGPRSTPLPAPPAGSSPETAPHERGWRLYTTSSHRSQQINANRSRFWQANLERLSRRGFIPISPSRHSDAP